jgi:hypothetical protein
MTAKETAGRAARLAEQMSARVEVKQAEEDVK